METTGVRRIASWFAQRKARIVENLRRSDDFGVMACQGCTLNCQQGRVCPSRWPRRSDTSAA